MSLYGCPFCRELVPEDEAEPDKRVCSVCGVALLPIERLPPSYETRAAQAAELEATPPEHRKLPLSYLRRGRGALLAVAVVGIAAFFLPWIRLIHPDDAVLSGFHIARFRAGWFWGGAVGWFVLIPLVASRRTIAQMRGVRAVVAMFASLSLVEVIFLLVKAPSSTRYVTIEYSWGYGLWLSAVAGAAGTVLGALFGGRIDDISLPRQAGGKGALDAPLRETSDGRTVH